MNEISACPHCEALLPRDAPEGLCPRCLLAGALAEEADADVAAEQRDVPPVGTMLRYFGDYELLDEISRGAMGVVYKAKQRSLDRTVAVKMILGGRAASETDIERFHGEAEAAASLQHPSIVSIYEVGEHEGLHYFSMDFIDGESLADRVTRDDRLSPEQAAVWLRAMAEAVDYAHRRGVIHRDLKPSNVLIDRAGQPRITDFGLAKRQGRGRDLTQTGTILGTVAYMSPEQAMGRTKDVVPASDIYSLGAMLYEMLTGQPPFEADTLQGTLSQVAEEEPVPPRKRRHGIPRDLETICLRCLEKRPERRYSSAAALAEDLDRYLDRRPVRARPIPMWRRASHWAIQRPWRVTATVALFYLGLLTLSYGLWVQNRYLVWTSVHAHVREPGTRTERLEQGAAVGSVLFVLTVLSGVLYRRYGKQRTGREAWSASPRPDDRPPHPALLSGYGLAGGSTAAFGLYHAARAIETWVWEGASSASSFLLSAFVVVYLCLWGGGTATWEVAADLRRRIHGAREDGKPAKSRHPLRLASLVQILLAEAVLLALLYWILPLAWRQDAYSGIALGAVTMIAVRLAGDLVRVATDPSSSRAWVQPGCAAISIGVVSWLLVAFWPAKGESSASYWGVFIGAMALLPALRYRRREPRDPG
jgi:serine/threonine protein kinase